jgi:hypothetical protein
LCTKAKTKLPPDPSRHHPEPLLGIAHISGWVVASLDRVGDDSTSIDIGVAVDLFFRDDVDNFLSREFFVLSGFCHKSLVCGSPYERGEELLLCVATLYVVTLGFECVGEAIGLVLLHLIIPDQIDQVDDDGDETDEDVVETGVQEK